MKNRWIAAGALLTAVLTLTGCQMVTIVPIGVQSTAQFYYEDTEFDANKFADEAWPEILAFTEKNASAATEVMAQFKSGKEQCREKFGFKQPTEGAGYNYIVTDKVKVLNVDNESKAGKMFVDAQPYDGTADFVIQIGTVYKGLAVRDAMPFINFGDFKNQMSYGDVGKAINACIHENVVAPIDPPSLADKEITFVGVYSEADEPLVVPTKITVEG